MKQDAPITSEEEDPERIYEWHCCGCGKRTHVESPSKPALCCECGCNHFRAHGVLSIAYCMIDKPSLVERLKQKVGE